MIDSRALLYLPRWVRITALGLLLTAVAGSAGLAWTLSAAEIAGSGQYGNQITIALALAQTALSALAVVLIVVFSERDLNTAALQQRTGEFLEKHLPAVLARVTPSYAQRASASDVSVLGRSDIFGATYRIRSGDQALMLWVGLNVSRLTVIYWLAGGDGLDAARCRQLFQFTFGGAAKVGFDVFYEDARGPDGQPIVSIWAAVKAGENLLTVPAERLFWMQDIAMMTESFWRTTLRHGLALADAEPSPL